MVATADSKSNVAATKGAGFLLAPLGSAPVFSSEQFTDEQRAYYKTAMDFAKNEIIPAADALEKKNNPLLRSLLKKAGDLGLLGAALPEAHGGLDQDETTNMLLAEASAATGSWSATLGAHTGIGTEPILLFGNESQKKKYLPKHASGEWIGAYGLTEQGSGSDALGAKTTAKLTPDGKHYILNGGKQFITNAGFADVFIVFAKIDGQHFTGFIVDKGAPGFSVGPEEHKMGIRGSSTCALVFEDCKVPAENLLGEIGKGHKIAFNILNLGRLKLGVGCLGGCKRALEQALLYAKDRKQFNTAIVEFGLIREKLGRMAADTYALESMSYRTTGMIDARLKDFDHASPDFHRKHLLETVEEFAVEASIMKVVGSETLWRVVDEAVQIHGGYGFVEEYPIERAYRDNRVNRIFEGTNEINRMLITGMLLKKTMKGQFPLFDVAAALDQELDAKSLPGVPAGPLGPQARAAEWMKRLALYGIKVAAETFGPEIEKHQEVLASIAEVMMETYAVDSMVGRTLTVAGSTAPDPVRVALCQLYTTRAYGRAYDRAREVVCNSVSGDDQRKHLSRLAQLYEYLPCSTEALRETIMGSLLERDGYPFHY